MQKIDVVYLWVDGSDKKWLAEKNKYAELENDETIKLTRVTNAERYRDNGELKYSLRSLEKYVPWVNHIYIVTGFGQIPKWLNTKHPKITIVPHEQIMPSDALPTFNSTAINMGLGNIPNLSEHFLVTNDDIIFNKILKPSFFFNKRGRPITHFVSNKHIYRRIGYNFDNVSVYRSKLLLCAKLIKDLYGRNVYKYSPAHGVEPFLKSSWFECRNHPLIKPLLDKTTRNKFRKKNELQIWLFSLYNLVHKRGIFRRARPHKSGRNKILDFIYNTIHWYKTRKSTYVCPCVLGHEKSLKNCAVFCINDSGDNTPEMLQANIDYLKKLFPEKSSFEK
jgi:hypothetical protein